MVFDTMTALTSAAPLPAPNEICHVLGYWTPGDTGRGEFYWDASSTEADNMGTIIKATAHTIGRWKRLYAGEIKSKWFGLKGDGSDETLRLATLLNWLPNGSVLDFQQGSFGVYDGVTGVTSGDALPLSEVIRISDKQDIVLKNGQIFVVAPATASAKCRFPSTLTIDGSTNIVLQNLRLYSKGESYGDADASQSLSADARRPFLAQNGGHALVVIRSRFVKINKCQMYLAGSVGTCYISSSADVSITESHANPASLGYAGYAIDAWCGDAAYAGFASLDTYIEGCTAYAEDLGTGSSVYCGKAGITVEDRDVRVQVTGGLFADMWANGDVRNLGNAFTCGAASLYVHGSRIARCATVLCMFSSVNFRSYALIDGVAAEDIGMCAVTTFNESFGEVDFELLNCDINITSNRLWSEDPRQEFRESSVCCILKTTVSVNGMLKNCRITGNAKHLIINPRPVYGGLTIYSSDITVTDFIAKSAGWGSSGGDLLNAGLTITGGSLITVSSLSPTTALLNWNTMTVVDGTNVFTRLRLNLEDCQIYSKSIALRPLIALNDPTVGAVIDYIAFPTMLKGCYLTLPYGKDRIKRLYDVIGEQNLGLAGANTVWEFRIPGNRPPAFPCRIIADDESFNYIFQNSSGYADAGDGTIKVALLLQGDVRSKFTVGNKYTVME